MGMHQPTWLMTAAWSATAGLVLDRRRTWQNWTFHRPDRGSATDRLLSIDHASGTVYWHQFTTRHCHWHVPATDSSLMCSFNSCGVCDSERTLHKCSKHHKRHVSSLPATVVCSMTQGLKPSLAAVLSATVLHQFGTRCRFSWPLCVFYF